MSLFYVDMISLFYVMTVIACKYDTMEIKFGINDTEMSCVILGTYKKIGWK